MCVCMFVGQSLSVLHRSLMSVRCVCVLNVRLSITLSVLCITQVPDERKVYLCVFVCLSVCLSVYQSHFSVSHRSLMSGRCIYVYVCLSVCLSISPTSLYHTGPRWAEGVSMCVCMSVCLSVYQSLLPISHRSLMRGRYVCQVTGWNSLSRVRNTKQRMTPRWKVNSKTQSKHDIYNVC